MRNNKPYTVPPVASPCTSGSDVAFSIVGVAESHVVVVVVAPDTADTPVAAETEPSTAPETAGAADMVIDESEFPFPEHAATINSTAQTTVAREFTRYRHYDRAHGSSARAFRCLSPPSVLDLSDQADLR